MKPFLSKIIICPSCSQRNLIKGKSSNLYCKECNKEFLINQHNQTIIFEEVYKPKNREPIYEKLLDNKKAKEWRSLSTEEVINWIANLNKEDIILDLGCGPLKYSKFFNKKNTIFVDGGFYKGIDIVCNFEKKIPIANSSIDAILFSNVLEHIYDPKNCLKEINRVLKKNGKCLIIVPFAIKHHQEPFDFNRYTRHYLKRISNETGFKITKFKEIGSISNILGTIYRIQNKEHQKPKTIKDKLIQLLRKLTYFIYKIDRYFSINEKPSKVLPQGFVLELIK